MNFGVGPVNREAMERFRDPHVPDHIFEAAAALDQSEFEGVDAVILNAVLTDYHGRKDEPVYYGYIFGDKATRFHEGKWIHTSRVLSGPDENGVVKTRNSTYRIKLKPEIEIADVTGTAQP